MKMFDENEEQDLYHHWFIEIGQKQKMYKEPILDTDTVKFFKQVCEAFEQDSHVFVLSVEVGEDYIRAKNNSREKIKDPLLAAVTIIFICHKCEGAPESLKIKHVIDILYYFTHKHYESSEITAMEGDILITLSGQLPINTPLDDLDIIVEKYVRESRLRADIRPLCLKILEFVYIERVKWFEELKQVYSENKDCAIVFRNLISSKFYIPVSILLAALKSTHYRHILDVDAILVEISQYTKIHEDHFVILTGKIMELIS